MFAVQRLGRWRAVAPIVVLALVLGLVASNLAAPMVHAAGTNYYVDSVNGNDNNSGTSSSSPWRSLSKINGRSFGAGDVINLARGSSWTGGGGTSSTLTINGSGASGSPITVQPYGTGAAPILRNPSTSNSRVVWLSGSWIVVQGLNLREGHEAAVFLPGGSNNNVIKNNELSASGAGVQVQSQYNLVTGNNIHDLTMVVNTPGGDDDYGATAVLLKASNNEVSYNRFVNCKASSSDYGQDGGGVELFGTVDNVSIHHNYSNNTKGYIEVGGGSARNTLVAYNVIVNPESAIGLHLSGGFASTVDNFRFFNNTFIGNGGYGLFYNDGNLSGSQLIVRNNIFYANNYGILMQGSTGFTHDHNLYYFTGSQPNLNYGMGTGERVVDPMLVNVGGGDYHLRSGSPAINTGASTVYNTDLDGNPVPAGGAVDIGAYEYGSTASPTATAAPTKPASTATAAPTKPAATATATQVTGPVSIDDFNSYAGTSALQSAWPVANGTQVSVGLDGNNKAEGAYGMSYAYTVGTNNYGGISRSFSTPANWSGKSGISFWLKPDGSGRSVHVQFRESGGEYWEASYLLSGTAATNVYLPFSNFKRPGWYVSASADNGVIDLASINQFSLYVNQDSTPAGSSTIYFDAIQATNAPALTATPAPTKPAPTATAVPTQPPAPTATAAPTKPAPTATTVPTKPAPTATAVPTQAPAPTNLLKNGAFESGLAPWSLKVTSPASASLSLASGNKLDGAYSAAVNISNASGTAHYIQLRQDNVSLQAGRQYQVTFWAKASSSRTISSVAQQQVSPFNLYTNKVVTLSTSWQKFGYTFTAGESTSAFIGFNLGSSGSTVWIDSVSVVPL